jgi:predicted phage-related endonuclease
MLTEEQQKMRRTGYGASEVAALVGSGMRSPIEIYADKVLGPEPDEPSLPARLGQVLEAGVADVYAELTSCWLLPVNTLRHPKLTLALCTPDRARFTQQEIFAATCKRLQGRPAELEDLQEAERLVQVKTTAARYRGEYGPPGTDEIPFDKLVQVQWEMGVTGLPLCDVPVLFRSEWGVSLEIYSVAADAALFASLYEEVERFHHDHVLAQKPPEPTGAESYDAFLARAYPAATRAQVRGATPEEEAMLLDWSKVLACEARLKAVKGPLRQRLQLSIGEAEGIESELGRLTWKRTKDGTKVDWQKAANDALLLAGQCLNAFDVLEKSGEQLSPENRAALAARLQQIIPEATTPKPGYRRLNPSKSLRQLFAGEPIEGVELLLAAGEGGPEAEAEEPAS